MRILIDQKEHTFESIDLLESHLRATQGEWEFLELPPEENQKNGFRITMVAEADDGFGYTIDHFPKENEDTSFFFFDDFDAPDFDWAFGILKEFHQDQDSTISKYKWEEMSSRVTNRNTLYIVGGFVMLLIVFALLNKH